MTTRRGNPDQYLQKVGGTYYARVRVPRTLEKYTGQTHIRQSLKTGEKAEANRLKHAVVGKIKAQLDALRKAPKRPHEPGMSFADAREWREQVQRLEAAGDYETVSTLDDVAVSHAEELERLYGHDRASKWYRIATNSDETLKELMGKWMSVSDYRESTKHGHRKALDEVLSFIDNEHALPKDVTRKTALAYIDNDLTQRKLAHSTIRDRLVSLGGFWSWMASRNVVSKESNPWTGHKISKKQNAGQRPPKRAYTEDELLALLKGTPKAKTWATYPPIADLIVLGMFTGARIEELCSLDVADIETGRGHQVITIKDSKTKAGIRLVGITHPAPLAVLKRRTAAKKGRVFPELSEGGYDEKFSAAVSKAFGRYRRACGVPDGTDNHSFRRTVVTLLEAAGVGQVAIARFVGHKVGTLAGDTYSEGGSKANSLETSKRLRYGKKVEAAVTAFAG
jgi:integrase